MPGVDCWDEDRDARKWQGGCAVVAHPPCAQWSRLAAFAHDKPETKALGPLAVAFVRAWGGVLEHPCGSGLWDEMGLAAVGKSDGVGWTLPISQFWFGHRCEKKTYLYIVGCSPGELPSLPFAMGDAPRVVSTSTRREKNDPLWRPEVGKREREATPALLAQWLVDVAQICNANMRNKK